MLMAVLGATLAPCAAAPAPDIAPAAFIGAFYRDYFADPAAARKRHVDGGSFYSSGLLTLMAANRAACAKTRRQDSKCGWNVDGDEFLHTQERDPALTLASSGFAAKAVGAAAVDVTFRVFPNEPESQRAVRYLLVRENGQWRVDDVIDEEKGAYSSKNGLRRYIVDENRYANANALDVAEAARWVNAFVQSESAQSFARFAAFPLTVCDTTGGCVPYKENDARLPLLVRTLYLSYFDKGVLPLPVPRGAARQGKVARSGPFDYRFQQGQWWLSRVDLRRAPVRQKQALPAR
ncbi:DUF3828 domain-containing protein [Massilia aquatica]|nr:DUF3828 domain-containing protein [Massilia aquatica]